MTTGTLPPETFRLYVGDDFFVVSVADTVDAMRDSMRAHAGWCHPDQLACVISAWSPQLPGLVGVIYLPKDRLGSGLVAHELSHAAFRLMERRGLKVRHWRSAARLRWLRWAARVAPAFYERLATDANPDEEAYASVHEHLTKTFWQEAYAHGVA